MTHLDDFLRGYVVAMLWANAYDTETGEPIEDMTYAYHTPGNWWTDTPVELDDAIAFYNNESPRLWETGQRDFSQHGHDFALTRNHHGAGFWDRGYGALGDTLTAAAYAYGESSVGIVRD